MRFYTTRPCATTARLPSSANPDGNDGGCVVCCVRRIHSPPLAIRCSLFVAASSNTTSPPRQRTTSSCVQQIYTGPRLWRRQDYQIVRTPLFVCWRPFVNRRSLRRCGSPTTEHEHGHEHSTNMKSSPTNKLPTNGRTNERTNELIRCACPGEPTSRRADEPTSRRADEPTSRRVVSRDFVTS